MSSQVGADAERSVQKITYNRKSDRECSSPNGLGEAFLAWARDTNIVVL